MNYKKIYDDFISDRLQKQIIDGYFETHYIVPKSYGGLNKKENLIKLTAKDHFFAHILLAKIYKGKMIFALNMMCKTRTQTHKNKSIYEVFKKQIAKEISKVNKNKIVKQETKDKLSKTQTGKKHTLERIENNRNAQLGKVMTEETKEKISQSLKGKKKPKEHGKKIAEYNRTRIFTEEHRQNISNSLKGSKLSDETKRKMSESKTGYKYPPQEQLECPYCKKTGGKVNMKRYHFENCKLK
jgi:hypothetical protein